MMPLASHGPTVGREGVMRRRDGILRFRPPLERTVAPHKTRRVHANRSLRQHEPQLARPASCPSRRGAAPSCLRGRPHNNRHLFDVSSRDPQDRSCGHTPCRLLGLALRRIDNFLLLFEGILAQRLLPEVGVIEAIYPPPAWLRHVDGVEASTASPNDALVADRDRR